MDIDEVAPVESTEQPGTDSASDNANEFDGLFSFGDESTGSEASIDVPGESSDSNQHLDEGAEGGEGGESTAVETAPPGEAEPAPSETAETKPETPAPETPAATEPTPTPAKDTQEETQQATPEQIQEWRNEFVGKQVKDFGGMMTEDFLEELQTNPAQAFPQMAAEVLVKAHDLMLPIMQQMIANSVPQMAVQANQQYQSQVDGEKKFFTAFPELNTPEMREVVTRVGMPYRQANPEVDAERFIKDVGTSAWIAGGLDMAVLQQRLATLTGGGNSNTPPPANNQPAPRQAPFKPASPGSSGTGGVRSEQTSANEFELLVEDDL